MVYLTNEDRRREVLAREGALAFAAIASWQTEPTTSTVPPAVAAYLYSPTVDVVLAHWGKNVSIGKLLAAARETRLDIVLIEPAWMTSGGPAFSISMILCRNGETSVYRGLRLWAADVESAAWLVPDPHDRDLDHVCFDLSRKRITPESHMPFCGAEARDLGLMIGGIRWKATVGGHLI